MALPPIIRKSDAIPLISPADSALDPEAKPDAFAAYAAGLDRAALDIEAIPRVDGADPPTVFHCRPLTVRELDLARSLAAVGLDLANGDMTDEERILTSMGFLGWLIRLGIDRVENPPEGFAGFRRERRYGVTAWPAELADSLDPTTFAHLGMSINTLSTVPLS